MLQASLPVCLLRRPQATTKLRLKGGTNVPFSPGLDHARLVLAPNLKLMGVNLDVNCVKRGFMPEGGGQLLRVAVALGVGLGRDVRVKNIRAARSKPGLRPQHVASLRVAAAVGGVSVAGGVGAVEITVRGSQATDQTRDVFEADAGTAGSTTLMLQASLPVCLLRRPTLTTKLRLKGGTNVPFSPGLDHARLVLSLIHI